MGKKNYPIGLGEKQGLIKICSFSIGKYPRILKGDTSIPPPRPSTLPLQVSFFAKDSPQILHHVKWVGDEHRFSVQRRKDALNWQVLREILISVMPSHSGKEIQSFSFLWQTYPCLTQSCLVSTEWVNAVLYSCSRRIIRCQDQRRLCPRKQILFQFK